MLTGFDCQPAAVRSSNFRRETWEAPGLKIYSTILKIEFYEAN